MAARRRNWTVVALCAGLGGLAVVGAAAQGSPTFTGIRWVPDWSAPPPPEVLPPAPGPEMSPLPGLGEAGEPSTFPLGQILLGVIAVVLAVIAVILVRRWLARRTRVRLGLREVGALANAEPALRPAGPEQPEPETVRRGVDEALRLLDDEREPRDAIVRAWIGLQQTAEEAGIRRAAAETPTEFTARILSRVRADDRAVAALLALYLRARFGDDPITPERIDEARTALESLAASWDDRAGSRR